jgi:hypothetical protein
VKLLLSAAFVIAIGIVGVGSYIMSSPPSTPPVVASPYSYSRPEVDALRTSSHLAPSVELVAPDAISRPLLDATDISVLVAFPGDPHSSAAEQYLRTTLSPTGSGYLAWLAANGYPRPALRLVAVGAGPILPGHDHDHVPRGWLTQRPLIALARLGQDRVPRGAQP